jgi:hypothetical protein
LSAPVPVYFSMSFFSSAFRIAYKPAQRICNDGPIIFPHHTPSECTRPHQRQSDTDDDASVYTYRVLVGGLPPALTVIIPPSATWCPIKLIKSRLPKCFQSSCLCCSRSLTAALLFGEATHERCLPCGTAPTDRLQRLVSYGDL